MLPVMLRNSWFPTVFDDFFDNAFPTHTTNTCTAPAVSPGYQERVLPREPRRER